MTNQEPSETARETTTTQARYFGRYMKPRSNPPRSDSGTGYGLPELPKAWWKAPR